MSENIPSEIGNHNAPNLDEPVADFEEWEQELTGERHVAELSAELDRLTLVETIDYDPGDTPAEGEPEELEESEEPEKPIKPEKKEERPKYDPLNLQPERSSGESGIHMTEDELFSAAMGLIYFATGIPAEEVFEES